MTRIYSLNQMQGNITNGTVVQYRRNVYHIIFCQHVNISTQVNLGYRILYDGLRWNLRSTVFTGELQGSGTTL